jgi:hypothetical protein
MSATVVGGVHTQSGTMQLNLGSTLNAYVPYIDATYLKDQYVRPLPTYLLRSDVIEQTSFNLLDPTQCNFVQRYSVGGLNFVTDTLGIAASPYIPVTEGGWYVVSGTNALYGGSASGAQGGYFSSNVATTSIQNITWVAPVDNNGAAFQVPTGLGITHVVISLRKLADSPSATTLNGNIQLQLGEQATAYQAYALKDQIKTSLLPQTTTSSSSSGTTFDAAAWYKFVEGDEGAYLSDKFPLFKRSWLRQDKDLMVVNTGTSLTARTSEHCTLRSNPDQRPPLLHTNNLASLIWDKIAWSGQQYRRYDSASFFTETGGGFATGNAAAEWDDGPYRDGFTRYSSATGAGVSFTIPTAAWQFNFIYRTDSVGSTTNTITIAEGNNKVQVLNSSGTWVEANGFTFSMREATPTTRVVSVPDANTGTSSNVTLASKGNTQYQKRLKMRCRSADGSIDSRTTTKSVSIVATTAGRFLYWGVEWSPRQYMITYVNAARGSHSTRAEYTTGLPRFQDNEIWAFKPDLLFFELPIHNDGAGDLTAAGANAWANLTNNFVFRADYELSLKTRGTSFGLTPEIGMHTSSITYNFGDIAEDGTLKFAQQNNAQMMTSLDKYNQAFAWVNENYPGVPFVNTAKRWVDAGFAIFGGMKEATIGSGKGGNTFTNEGSHWNDTGSKVASKTILPLFNFTL